MTSMRDEVEFALRALGQAVDDMLEFEHDAEGDYLRDGQPYPRIKTRIDDASEAIRDEGLTHRTAAMGVLALMEAVLLTTSESHPEMIRSAVRMTEAAERLS